MKGNFKYLFWVFLLECDDGFFGENCIKFCGYCFGFKMCDYVIGICFKGCELGYMGKGC